jgi:PBSX family phage terminase large subunit
MRIREGAGKSGLNVMLGYTQGTLKRNIIAPLQAIWGNLVSDINTNGISIMFGEPVYCLGADKVNAVNRVRGGSWKWAMCDEYATYNEELFTMAKSRLDRPNAKADLTCNPDSPLHWAKKFMDSDIDKYVQHFTIFDNPFLDKAFVDNLCREYAGTVYYDRYILGKWVRAEGVCFPSFKDRNILDEVPGNILFVEIGADIGGNGSATSYTAVGYFKPKDKPISIVVLDELYDTENKDTETILQNFKTFTEGVKRRWRCVDAYCDSAEQLILKSMQRLGIVNVGNSMKRPIIDRIRFFDMMYATERAFIMKGCTHAIEAVQSAVWDDKAQKDTRLDNGTTNIDSLDSMEYAVERRMKELLA